MEPIYIGGEQKRAPVRWSNASFLDVSAEDCFKTVINGYVQQLHFFITVIIYITSSITDMQAVTINFPLIAHRFENYVLNTERFMY